MSNYYTSAITFGNQILYRGISNGVPVKRKVAYKPILYLPSKKVTEWKTLHGEYVEPMKFENIRDARDFVKRYAEVDNFKIYGNTMYQYALIAEPRVIMANSLIYREECTQLSNCYER